MAGPRSQLAHIPVTVRPVLTGQPRSGSDAKPVDEASLGKLQWIAPKGA